jgi:hypothetical protein
MRGEKNLKESSTPLYKADQREDKPKKPRTYRNKARMQYWLWRKAEVSSFTDAKSHRETTEICQKRPENHRRDVETTITRHIEPETTKRTGNDPNTLQSAKHDVTRQRFAESIIE